MDNQYSLHDSWLPVEMDAVDVIEFLIAHGSQAHASFDAYGSANDVLFWEILEELLLDVDVGVCALGCFVAQQPLNVLEVVRAMILNGAFPMA